MAQKTQLQALGTPGQARTFSVKTSASIVVTFDGGVQTFDTLTHTVIVTNTLVHTATVHDVSLHQILVYDTDNG